MKDDPEANLDTPVPVHPTADATPAYRGYRRQALYTLSRVIAPSEEGKIFQPEGIEDLAIYDDGDLVEAIQVKSRSDNITLSDLVSTGSPESSFFHRAVDLVLRSASPIVKLVSFGPIGPELERAIAGDEVARSRVSQKLVDAHGFTSEDVVAVFQILKAEKVDEADLTQRFLDFLQDAVTGADPEAAFDLLNHWLYECAERKSRISR